MQTVYKPDAAILQQRAELSKIFSGLRRVRPRLPFWYLPAHRIPTLWLYRGLIRHAPGPNIKWRIRMFFDTHRHLTSPKATREKLVFAHKLLDSFRSASDGNERLQKVLARYDSMIHAKRDKEEMKSMILEQLAWQDRLRNRPIMTGAFLRPSILNGPLPRLRPQPGHITMMMKKRIHAYQNMGGKYVLLKDMLHDIAAEETFEKKLAHEVRSTFKIQKPFKRVFYEGAQWDKYVRAEMADIRNSLQRATDRASTPYSPEMLAAIKEARREKIRNKTRERERERRGEVLRCTIEKSRQGPPAHLRERMPEWRVRADRVIRNASEVGYVGMMKSRLGIKMKNPNLWRELEEGNGEESEYQGNSNVEDGSVVANEGETEGESGKECTKMEDSADANEGMTDGETNEEDRKP